MFRLRSFLNTLEIVDARLSSLRDDEAGEAYGLSLSRLSSRIDETKQRRQFPRFAKIAAAISTI